MKDALRLRRFQTILAAIERWEKKERRAKNALRKLNKRRAYYLGLMASDVPELSPETIAQRKANNKANKVARRIVALRDMPRTDRDVPVLVDKIVKEM